MSAICISHKQFLAKNFAAVELDLKGLIPRQRNSSRETVYAKYGWLGMNDSIEFSHFFRLRSE